MGIEYNIVDLYLNRKAKHGSKQKPPKFEFINSGGPENPVPSDARRAARAHVMRKFHEENRIHPSGSRAGNEFNGSERPAKTSRQPMILKTRAASLSGVQASLDPLATPDRRRLPTIQGSFNGARVAELVPYRKF